MSNAPDLLNADGTASMATAFMMSHHAFRRDLARFLKALERVERGDRSRLEALREEWTNFHMGLHGHHQMEDSRVFPGILAEHEAARATVERLSADHRRLDPLLERADAAFAALPSGDARAILLELHELLAPHLALEEAELVPHLRAANGFPVPPDEAMLAMYAQGFAWTMQGIAPAVLDALLVMLPEALRARLPAARADFDARCQRVWGPLECGAATTPIPDGD